MTSTTTTYKFKKGEKKRLDDIYDVQGFGPHTKWWDYADGEGSEDIIITTNITITIKIKTE